MKVVGRLLAALLLAAFATGCASPAADDGDADEITVTDVDGSSDHRIFRAGGLTRVLLEPVVWRLVDSEKISLDWSVTDCLKTTPIPPEYERLTLRTLLAGEAALPDDFAMEDDETPRAAFVRGLWRIRTRGRLMLDAPHPSDVAYALFWFAVSERLGMSFGDLLDEYLVKPYGLKDTSFEPVPSRRPRLVRAEAVEGERLTLPRLFAGGLLTSPHDILRVAYVMLPHVAARSRARLQASTLLCGNEILYALWESSDGAAFLGFDVVSKRVILRLTTAREVGAADLLVKMDGLAS